MLRFRSMCTSIRSPRPSLRALAVALALVALLPLAVVGCAQAEEPPADEAAAATPVGEAGPGAQAADEEPPVLVGEVTREEIETAVPAWGRRSVEAEIDAEAAEALAQVEPGARVVVYLGTWCGDSRREVPRFWRSLDQVGGEVPFEVSLVAVDRDKEQPADLLAGEEIHYVPTFVVLREGEEVGRVVESAPDGIERDLLSLLEGEASGIVTGRDDGALPEEP